MKKKIQQSDVFTSREKKKTPQPSFIHLLNLIIPEFKVTGSDRAFSNSHPALTKNNHSLELVAVFCFLGVYIKTALT